MNRTQKDAVFNLVVFSIAALITTAAIITLYCLFGWPKAALGLAFLSIGGLGGLSPFIFKKDAGAVTYDERDKLINRTAALGGFAASYVWFCLSGTALVNLCEPMILKSFGLPLMIFGGLLVVFIVRSIMLLVLYGRGGGDGEK
jgi:hypothetical protein